MWELFPFKERDRWVEGAFLGLGNYKGEKKKLVSPPVRDPG